MRRLLPALAVAISLFAACESVADEPAVGLAGTELTPMGAIRDGDKYRFIPPWTGGLTGAVRGQLPDQHPPDAFVEDGRWFTVTQADLERYKVRMPEGQRELLRRYKSFEIPMYPSRRTAAAPRAFYEATVANAGKAQLTDGGLTLTEAHGGIPFPVPKTGAEAMWNHLLRWRGGAMTRTNGIAIPDQYGAFAVDRYREDWLPAYTLGLDAPAALYYRRIGLSAADPLDNAALAVQDSLQSISQPRQAWYRPPKDKRVVRAPDFVYGTPDPVTKGIRTADMLDMFSGALDRFEYRLIGRKSMYVPYNVYRLLSPSLTPKDFLWAEHPNPGFLRYELHRVWVVEATLKRGYRHPFPERTYYLDEDSWQILMADHFGPDGTLLRYSEAHGIVCGEIPAFVPMVEITYDFKDNRYVISGLDNQEKAPAFGVALTPDDFGAAALTVDPRRNRQ